MLTNVAELRSNRVSCNVRKVVIVEIERNFDSIKMWRTSIGL
jgi:hypothetical protein